MEGRLQALYPSFKLPRRGHFFAARSAKKRRRLITAATITEPTTHSLMTAMTRVAAAVGKTNSIKKVRHPTTGRRRPRAA